MPAKGSCTTTSASGVSSARERRDTSSGRLSQLYITVTRWEARAGQELLHCRSTSTYACVHWKKGKDQWTRSSKALILNFTHQQNVSNFISQWTDTGVIDTLTLIPQCSRILHSDWSEGLINIYNITAHKTVVPGVKFIIYTVKKKIHRDFYARCTT